MRFNTHTDFILSPVLAVLQDAISASAGVGEGIETFPLCDYVMQSVFIRMTGFQEQKMKCICWEMANADYEYRYELLRKPLGECSSYSDRNDVYKGLVSQIAKYNSGFSVDEIDRAGIWTESVSDIDSVFKGSNLLVWAEKLYLDYCGILNEIGDSDFFVSEIHFFSDTPKSKSKPKSDSKLRSIYVNHFYRHRNRVAHNTSSYQQNLPTLRMLVGDEHKYENYFIFFFIMVVVDKLFVDLYSRYLLAIEGKEC